MVSVGRWLSRCAKWRESAEISRFAAGNVRNVTGTVLTFAAIAGPERWLRRLVVLGSRACADRSGWLSGATSRQLSVWVSSSRWQVNVHPALHEAASHIQRSVKSLVSSSVQPVSNAVNRKSGGIQPFPSLRLWRSVTTSGTRQSGRPGRRGGEGRDDRSVDAHDHRRSAASR